MGQMDAMTEVRLMVLSGWVLLYGLVFGKLLGSKRCASAESVGHKPMTSRHCISPFRRAHHIHALLLGGQHVMASLYPGFIDRLVGLGAVRCRAGTEITFYLPTGKAFSITGTVAEPRDLGFDLTCQSRGLLEYCVRQCTLRHPNIVFEGESTVQGLRRWMRPWRPLRPVWRGSYPSD